MQTFVFRAIWSLFIAFTTFFSAAFGNNVSVKISDGVQLSESLLMEKQDDLRHFLLNKSIHLNFNDFSGRLSLTWVGTDDLSLSIFEFGTFDSFFDCERSAFNFENASKKSGVINVFCAEDGSRVSLRGIDVFYKNYSSLRARKTKIEFNSFDSCFSTIYDINSQFIENSCVVASICNFSGGRYVPVYFEKFFCCFEKTKE